MTIPDYQSIMLPLLSVLKDGQEHVNDEYVERLAEYFHISADERREMLPSGRQPVFVNRVGWATTYLSKAGLVERTARKRVRITARGRNALEQGLQHIDNDYLTQFSEFVEFRRRNRSDNGSKQVPNGESGTPRLLNRLCHLTSSWRLATCACDRLWRRSYWIESNKPRPHSSSSSSSIYS